MIGKAIMSRNVMTHNLDCELYLIGYKKDMRTITHSPQFGMQCARREMACQKPRHVLTLCPCRSPDRLQLLQAPSTIFLIQVQEFTPNATLFQ
jgi:hypothetical protein